MPAIETQIAQEKTLFPSSSGSMFQNYFGAGREESYNKRELIDARGRRLFENAALACSLDVYPFQQAMSTRPGPTVQVDENTMILGIRASMRRRLPRSGSMAPGRAARG